MADQKTVILGVTGSIAAYKAAEIASGLTGARITVKTVMTENATRFIAPLTFESVTGQRAFSDLWSSPDTNHVKLAGQADAVLIAPATANILAKLAAGLADDFLTCLVLAADCPVIVAPAMHSNMWQNEATQHNVSLLRQRGFIFVEPSQGRLASGGFGPGRLADPAFIAGIVKWVLGRSGDLAGKKIVITAGGTKEPIDPVRFVGNRSSGKMGLALAAAGRNRGAQVVLVTTVTPPDETAGMETRLVETAGQMLEAVKEAVSDACCLIMPAAVADYKPEQISAEKIKKGDQPLEIRLVPVPDILKSVSGSFKRIGFAAETEDLEPNAVIKLKSKDLDLIVANDVSSTGATFGSEDIRATLIYKNGTQRDLPLMPKAKLADIILDTLK